MNRIPLLIATAVVAATITTSAFAQDAEEEKNPGLFGTSFLEGWKRNFGLGITGTDGNVNEIKFVADLKGEYEDKRHRRKLTSQFYLSKPDNQPGPGPQTDRKVFAEYEENWKPFDNAFYFLGTGRYDYERLQVWNQRIAASAGVGYEFINTERLKFRGSVGAGVAYKYDVDRGADDSVGTETIPEGVIRVGLDYNLMPGVDFTTTHTYYPNFDQTDELRVISSAEIKADIGEAGGLNVSIGVENEYDSIADNEDKSIEENDLTYYLRLGYAF